MKQARLCFDKAPYGVTGNPCGEGRPSRKSTSRSALPPKRRRFLGNSPGLYGERQASVRYSLAAFSHMRTFQTTIASRHVEPRPMAEFGTHSPASPFRWAARAAM